MASHGIALAQIEDIHRIHKSDLSGGIQSEQTNEQASNWQILPFTPFTEQTKISSYCWNWATNKMKNDFFSRRKWMLCYRTAPITLSLVMNKKNRQYTALPNIWFPYLVLLLIMLTIILFSALIDSKREVYVNEFSNESILLLTSQWRKIKKSIKSKKKCKYRIYFFLICVK